MKTAEEACFNCKKLSWFLMFQELFQWKLRKFKIFKDDYTLSTDLYLISLNGFRQLFFHCTTQCLLIHYIVNKCVIFGVKTAYSGGCLWYLWSAEILTIITIAFKKRKKDKQTSYPLLSYQFFKNKIPQQRFYVVVSSSNNYWQLITLPNIFHLIKVKVNFNICMSFLPLQQKTENTVN